MNNTVYTYDSIKDVFTKTDNGKAKAVKVKKDEYNLKPGYFEETLDDDIDRSGMVSTDLGDNYILPYRRIISKILTSGSIVNPYLDQFYCRIQYLLRFLLCRLCQSTDRK